MITFIVTVFLVTVFLGIMLAGLRVELKGGWGFPLRQHNDHKWVVVKELLEGSHVHENMKLYFQH